tara:strand:- start:364 stop:1206 length:843 start_codon:yes stop_codon:yes gene_type:complete
MAEDAFPPKLFLIGAQKAGTTTLAHLLNQHPDIVLSDPKEPGYFVDPETRGEAWYRSCFPPALPAVLLDASTGYTMAPVQQGGQDAVPARIKAVSPDAKFIYVLRDPVDRTISAYWHDKRSGHPLGDLRQAVDQEPFYVDVSLYHSQISLYLRHFPRERFLFVDFEEIGHDPVAVANRCIAFAGLDPNRAALRFDAPKNQSFQFNGIGRRFFDLFPNERAASDFVSAVKSITPDFVHRLAKSAMTKETEDTDPADRAWLAERFHDENRQMEALVGFRFYR